jgi:ubiquinone/menaquinone biosynthesis C-methylase UbiE
MLKKRIIETNDGIQDELAVEIYLSYGKFMRDKGWYGIDFMIQSGIKSGNILEVGPGPGFVGLEVVKKLSGATLTGCEISPAMIKVAEKNSADYGINAKYIQGNAMNMPFEDSCFDAVITNGSLHEWEEPKRVFNEIYRVLKTGGHYCITDLRRDIGVINQLFVYYATPKVVRPGLMTSLNASYTKNEILEILNDTNIKNASVKYHSFTLSIYGDKK